MEGLESKTLIRFSYLQYFLPYVSLRKVKKNMPALEQ